MSDMSQTTCSVDDVSLRHLAHIIDPGVDGLSTVATDGKLKLTFHFINYSRLCTVACCKLIGY